MKRIIILLNIFVLTLFMTSCGNKLKNDENYDSLGASKIVDESPHNYTLSEYLKSGKTLILYLDPDATSESLNKDDTIDYIIIFKDNLMSQYEQGDVKFTFGEISKMTDEEVIEFCEQSLYADFTNIEYQFEVYTDGTGNYTDNERIVSLNKISYYDYRVDEENHEYFTLIFYNDYYLNTTANVYDSTFFELYDYNRESDAVGSGAGLWYRPDGYILSLDAPDSDNVIVDP